MSSSLSALSTFAQPFTDLKNSFRLTMFYICFSLMKVIYIYIYMQQVCSSDKNEKNEAFFRLWAHPWKIQVQIYMNLPKEEFVAGIS